MCFSVLAHMSQPLECLIPNLRLQLQSLEKLRSNEQQVPHKLVELETLVQEIGSMLLKMKQAFTKPDVTQLILGKLTELLQQVRACGSIVGRRPSTRVVFKFVTMLYSLEHVHVFSLTGAGWENIRERC